MNDELDGMPPRKVVVDRVYKGKHSEFIDDDKVPEIGDTIRFVHLEGTVTRIVETEKDGYAVFTVTVDGDADE